MDKVRGDRRSHDIPEWIDDRLPFSNLLNWNGVPLEVKVRTEPTYSNNHALLSKQRTYMC